LERKGGREAAGEGPPYVGHWFGSLRNSRMLKPEGPSISSTTMNCAIWTSFWVGVLRAFVHPVPYIGSKLQVY
jgi:hypothetical protein